MILSARFGNGSVSITPPSRLGENTIEILKELKQIDSNDWLLTSTGIRLSQFFGIEIDHYAHEMAKLSLWIAEHQMNVVYSAILGEKRPTLPLSEPGNITCANALNVDWKKVCEPNLNKKIYLIGNPPYLGAKLQNKFQKKDLSEVFKKFKSFKNLDYIVSLSAVRTWRIRNGVQRG